VSKFFYSLIIEKGDGIKRNPKEKTSSNAAG